MFRILTFKHLAVISALVCAALLAGSALNMLPPVAEVFSHGSVTVPVVMYHQISENPSILGKYAITPQLLEEDFEYMKRNNITPISLQQALQFLESGKGLPQNPVILTFDDGEKTFITKVVPLLQRYGYPANINIIGALVELYTKSGDTDDRYAYLNSDDIKALAKNPLVEIGCHTYNLHSLSDRRGMGRLYGESESEYLKVIEEDLKKFNKLMNDLTGQAPKILAYPYGIRNNALFHRVKELGYTITLTCREETNVIAPGGNLYELGRFNRPYGTGSEDFFNGFYAL